MRKSLQEIIASIEDKDLSNLLTKVENSYIIKGLDWVDRKSNLERYFPESKAAKVFEFVRDLFFYGGIGTIPSVKQEKYTKALNHDRLLYTRYSILLGLIISGIKIGLASLSPYETISTGIGLWGLALFADDTTRAAYMFIRRKPIGDIIYMEGPYRLGKYLFKKRKEILKQRT